LNLLDENVLRTFEVPGRAIEEAIRFGALFGIEAADEPDSVQCAAFPPDGVKVVLSRDDRRLILYFFGDGQCVFGKQQGGGRIPQGEGEVPLSADAHHPREQLFDWLLGAT
jgi:hypothetical protein